MGGLVYFLHTQNVIDAKQLWKGVNYRESNAKRDDATEGRAGVILRSTTIVPIQATTPTLHFNLQDPNAAEGPHQAPMYNISIAPPPLPVITAIGWTIFGLVTVTVAYFRARLRLQFRYIVVMQGRI